MRGRGAVWVAAVEVAAGASSGSGVLVDGDDGADDRMAVAPRNQRDALVVLARQCGVLQERLQVRRHSFHGFVEADDAQVGLECAYDAA